MWIPVTVHLGQGCGRVVGSWSVTRWCWFSLSNFVNVGEFSSYLIHSTETHSVAEKENRTPVINNPGPTVFTEPPSVSTMVIGERNGRLFLSGKP